MPLTREEQLNLISLKDSPGYLLLLDAVNAWLDNVAQALEENYAGDTQNALLGLWRSGRAILRILRDTPEAVEELLHQELQLLQGWGLDVMVPRNREEFERAAKIVPFPEQEIAEHGNMNKEGDTILNE